MRDLLLRRHQYDELLLMYDFGGLFWTGLGLGFLGGVLLGILGDHLLVWVFTHVRIFW